MKFTLLYEGDLPPSGNAQAKMEIRQQIDCQMRRLWKFSPLNDIDKYRDKDYKPDDCYLGRSVPGIEGIEFIPPVSEKIATLVELKIVLLSSGHEAQLVVRGGDLDNRMKTLLDGLKAPSQKQDFSSKFNSLGDQRYYCLMDDDKSVTSLTVQPDRLLTVDGNSKKSVAVINAKIIAGAGLIVNIEICL